MSEEKTPMDRRSWLRQSLQTALVAGAALKVVPALGQACGLVTPAQTEGPFYPVWDADDQDNDLTRVKGQSTEARGERVIVHGQVLDEQCRPVEGAIVEVWQACDTGRYNHDADPNPAGLDRSFQYWGRFTTKADGRYWFKTIIPGAYPAAPGWMRPPHIHFKVIKLGFFELTTQMYFGGHQLNRQDRILRSLSAVEQGQVVVDFKPAQWHGQVGEMKQGQFDMTIKEVR